MELLQLASRQFPSLFVGIELGKEVFCFNYLFLEINEVSY